MSTRGGSGVLTLTLKGVKKRPTLHGTATLLRGFSFAWLVRR
jgi:hypothetical protein